MNYKCLSDRELWLCHQKGDTRAYNMLYERYANFLYVHAKRRMKNYVDSEEVVMNILLSLWLKKNVLSSDVGNNLKAYLICALRNHTINHYRKYLKKMRFPQELSQNVLIDSLSADYIVQSKELEEIYQSKLNLLSPQRLKVFKMSREEGMTYKQIAKRLNLSLNTVENYMAAALLKLREIKKY